VVIPTTALVASAVQFPGQMPRLYARPQTGWQREAWRHYDICPEFRFAANWVGNAMSRVVLQPATIDPTSHKVTVNPTGQAAHLLDILFAGRDGQAQMLEALGIHLTVAGECYIVGRRNQRENVDDLGEVAPMIWEIVSTEEMRVVGTTWTIVYGHGVAQITLQPTDIVIRVWRPHPRSRLEADAPSKALLPILTEIEWLTRHIFAQITSRVAGAGILPIPDTLEFPPPPPPADGEGPLPDPANRAESFMRVLGEGMMEPIRNPESPTAVVPLVVSGPVDAIKEFQKPITFWSELDQNSTNLRDEAIRRLALGMDMPPEIVLGIGASSGTGGAMNHWSAWMVDESAIKLHIEPLCELVCNALIVGYVRPVTGDPTDTLIYDTSSLRMRPDLSKQALELYDRGLISDVATVRESGFELADMPLHDQLAQWLLMKVAIQSSTPDMVLDALRDLGVKLNPADASAGTPREQRPTPSLRGHPLPRSAPEQAPSRQLPAALERVSEALVMRALERAGNRLRNRQPTKVDGVSARDYYLYVRPNGSTAWCLEDAWTTVPELCDGLAEPARLTAVLDSYCTMLLSSQTRHDRAMLHQYLQVMEHTG
jgi:hypothetical protein